VTISDNLRRQIVVAADHRCEYCKTSSQLTGTPLVMDHILPRSLGGTDEIEADLEEEAEDWRLARLQDRQV